MQTIIVSSKNKEQRNSFISANYNFSDSKGNSIILNSVEGKKISIAQARELINFASLRPQNSTQKVAVIDDAQLLTIEAQNALLKLVEEPPDYLQVILSVDDSKNLIDTVISRCVLIRVESHSPIILNDKTFELFDEFHEVLRMNVGLRFDWFLSNQSRFKDRLSAVNLLSSWEVFLRQFLVFSINAKSVIPDGFDIGVVSDISSRFDVRIWQSNLVYLSEVVDKIRANNASVSIGVESFLLNLPVISR